MFRPFEINSLQSRFVTEWRKQKESNLHQVSIAKSVQPKNASSIKYRFQYSKNFVFILLLQSTKRNIWFLWIIVASDQFFAGLFLDC